MMARINLTWRMWVLIFAIVFSLFSIFGYSNFFQEGVLVTSVDSNSIVFEEGLKQGDIITKIDGKDVKSLEDYSKIMRGKFNSNESEKTIIQTTDLEIIVFSNTPIEITVSEIPLTSLKTGLDISGGARALVQAEDRELSSRDSEELARILENRLNVYGIEDIKVDSISDLSGNNFVKIEIAGATPSDLKELISQQGKFEAKIGNETVFVGGEKDITSVSRAGQDVLIETPQRTEGGYFSAFSFTIYLSQDAAKRHAEITDELDVNQTPQGRYLSENLDLFLDDKLVNSLLISEGLKGLLTTQISISGSSTGETADDALENAKIEMNQLQTILITGSLPYKVEILRLDTISPSLGNDFLNSIFLAGIAALLAVAFIIFFRYKKIKSSVALIITVLSELIIILGIASLIRWNLDLPSIAGILATIGTGIDQQIIMLDEARGEKFIGIRKRMKRAFAIILGAYFTALVALIPLYWAAAGFFKGFAFTTIIGITAGILITRPAFSDMVKRIEE
jgi:preprotein translocase subunit SecD|tara:strand:- start:62493 stop:64022 length:1530 start_codon:yes stop_codon:yes gene_type:complete